MDKRSLVGLLIIGVILFGFSWYNSKLSQEAEAKKAVADSIYRAANPVVENNVDGAVVQAKDSVTLNGEADAKKSFLGEELFNASQGKDSTFVVENGVAKYQFGTKGGMIRSVELKDYTRFDGGTLSMFDPNSAQFDISLFLKREYSNFELNTSHFNFDPEVKVVDGNTVVSMKLPLSKSGYLELLYVIMSDNYMVDMTLNFVGMSDIIANQSDFTINWANMSYQNERSFKYENNFTTIGYNYSGDDSIEELGMSDGQQEEEINNKVKWVAFKQQFFSSVLVARDGDFQNSLLRYNTADAASGYVKDFESKLSVDFNPNTTSYNFGFYFGPNKYSVLKKYEGLNLQKLIPMGGWAIGWINSVIVIPLFDWLGRYIASYGIIILILTVIIKLLIAPLTYKSYISMAKMRLLKPEVDDISAKYPDKKDAIKKQQATMELYRKAGVNPMGGCLPMLIQFPILIAMFRFFPASIELRGESFLWAQDLSSYDSILTLPFSIPFYGAHVSLLTLLMAFSVYVTAKISSSQTAGTTQQMPGMQFMMLYMMPLMLLAWFNDYASGLSLYYLTSNIFTIGQTYAFRYGVSDEKLHKKMKENAKKPRKKSKWQQRLEEMQKNQQQQAKKR